MKNLIKQLIPRRLIYLEDNQGYSIDNCIFKTNCQWDISLLEKLSWDIPTAGRISTSFDTFKKELEKYGYWCKLIKRFRNCDENNHLFKKYNVMKSQKYGIMTGKIVVGATGNY